MKFQEKLFIPTCVARIRWSLSQAHIRQRQGINPRHITSLSLGTHTFPFLTQAWVQFRVSSQPSGMFFNCMKNSEHLEKAHTHEQNMQAPPKALQQNMNVVCCTMTTYEGEKYQDQIKAAQQTGSTCFLQYMQESCWIRLLLPLAQLALVQLQNTTSTF